MTTRRLRWTSLVLAFAELAGSPRASAADADAGAPAPSPPPTTSPPPAQASPPPGDTYADVPPTSASPPSPPPARSPLQDYVPPGYPPPPPGYYYPRPRLRRIRFKPGFLMMPFVGIHSYQQAEASNTGPGWRFGTFVGGRISDLVALNAEVRVDVTNPGDLPAGTSVHEIAYAATFSPLFQFRAEGVETVIGPKIGGIIVSQQFRDASSVIETTGLGFLVGANFGVFASVAPRTSLGGLFSVEVAKLPIACNMYGTCETANVPASVVVALTAAALF